MKFLLRFLCPLLLILSLDGKAQTNAGMPLVQEMATHFFFQYEAPDNFSYYEFEKRSQGWFVRMFNQMDGTHSPLVLFWDKKGQRYLPLDFALQDHPDSTTVAETIADYAKRFRLPPDEIIRFNRNLFYGYDGWYWDVISRLEGSPPTSDSLWECLGNAYDSYAGGYILPLGNIPFQNNDPDRITISDSEPFPLARAKKSVVYAQKSIAAYKKVYEMNNHYRCAYNDIRWRLNSQAMYGWNILQILGFDSLAAPFLEEVSFPDSVLQKAKQTLSYIKPNSILFTDGDTATFPIEYLQTKNLRRDVIVLDNLMFVLKRNIVWLDRKYQNSLFVAKPSAYLDPAFYAALYQSDDQNAAEPRLDSFLVALYASPDNPALPHVDSSLGRLYRYFTRHTFMEINNGKARNFYPDHQTARRISLSLPDNYLTLADVLDMDIVQRNLLSRHIYFTNPSEHSMFAPYCVKLGDGLWEFIPMEKKGVVLK